MSDELQTGWDAAVHACCNGHDDCSFGGMSIPHGYWLAAADCPLNHDETCAWCPVEAVTGFRGRVHESSLGALFLVPACQEHADQWVLAHPEWARATEPEPEPSWRELLNDLNPFARMVAEDYKRRMDNVLLGDTGPCPDEPGFDGIGALMKNVLAGPVQSDGPPWTHTFRPPEPVPVLDADGRPVLDEDGQPVLDAPLVPSFTFDVGGPFEAFGAKLRLGPDGAEPAAYLAGTFSHSEGNWTVEPPPELVVDSVHVTPVAKAPFPPSEFGEQYYRTADELHQLVLRSAKPTFTGCLAYLADGGEQR